MFARGTQLVFSRAYQTCGRIDAGTVERRGQVWVLGPLRLFEPFSTARREHEADVDDVVVVVVVVGCRRRGSEQKV